MKDYYAILEVGKNATAREIKKSYRRLAALHHPDKNGNAKTDLFHEINEAYQVLGDAAKRDAYDWEREFGSKSVQHQITFRKPAPEENKPKPCQPYLKYARVISLVSLVFCLLLAADYLLPQKEVREQVSKVEKQKGPAGRDVEDYPTAEVFTPSFKIPISGELINSFPPGSTITIHQTRIFSIFTKIERQLKGLRFTTAPDYSIYSIFVFLPIVLLVCSVIGAFFQLRPDLNFSLGLVNLILMIITMVITLL